MNRLILLALTASLFWQPFLLAQGITKPNPPLSTSLKGFVTLVRNSKDLKLAHGGGSDVGTGGDAIYCSSPTEDGQPEEGYYSLDYLLTLELAAGPSIQVNSWQHSAEKIQSLLSKASPTLSESFEEFVRLVRNSDYTKSQIWEKASGGLKQLKDEKIVEQIPENCLKDGKLIIIQAVIRLRPEETGLPAGKIAYKYVPVLLDKLEAQSPLQLSYLYVHEWLWSHGLDVEKNRKIDRFLHSEESLALSGEEVRRALKGFGLQID